MKMLNRWKTAVQNVSRWLMAWGSLFAAVPAGFLLSVTFFGDLVGNVVDIVATILDFLIEIVANDVNLKDGAPFLAWVIVGLTILFDLLADFTPNRKAVYGALIWPSLPLEMGGSWGKNINTWSTSLNKWFQDTMGEKLGESAAFTVAGTLVAVSVIAAHKVLRSGNAGGVAQVTTPVTTGTPTRPSVVTRRGR